MMSLQSERMGVMSNQDKIKSALKSIDDSLATINTNYEMLETHQYDKADRRSSVKNYFHGFRGLGNCPNKLKTHFVCTNALLAK